MKTVEKGDLRRLFKASRDSHKGENGRLLVIGGSKMFHASIFWAADVASRIVDLVHFTSPAMENNDLVRRKAKEGFWNGIVVPWERVEEYIAEDDCILIGPGMPRESGEEEGDVGTGEVTNRLLKKFPEKKWVIDGGALQEMDIANIPRNGILTPHRKEFEGLKSKITDERIKGLMEQAELVDQAKLFAKTYHCVVLLKGTEDHICAGGDCDEKVCKPGDCMKVIGGHEGRT